ncbi:DNA replication/repair protein RecF [Candidatus Rhabdochlamydia sp. T3358]|uniref:DNA replication/repair protein RecF n=1 Tax=Candidatus Rhabdochlamydia sp. T3358 TaxID=2099795 RepID=UPI0010BAB6A5|nr:DNA replication/repair protein RecF [Candidatus Rhabdochlamydia sp. T3358]VHO02694.1 DNA replication and repair protein RecF [Candidatus Rhabdochlamydia sp. T3358]
MYLKHLILRNFRNHKETDFHFSALVNLIYGNNGQGKTSVLEAIYFLSTGRSFRTHNLSDLIREGQQYFYLEAHFVKDELPQKLQVYYDQTTKRIQFNHTNYPTLTNIIGILPSVLSHPNDLALIIGTPHERRRFLDIYLSQADPLYLHHLSRYYKAMKQRNHALRAQEIQTLSAWEQIMFPSALYLIDKRIELSSYLLDPATKWLSLLSNKKDLLDIYYQSSLTKKDPSLLLKWEKNRHKDMLLKATSLGPHRDDLLFLLSGKQAKNFSSEGQKRSLIYALKLAQWNWMQQKIGYSPLLCIDDFGMQLDPERQENLVTCFSRFKQVFICSANVIKDKFADTTRSFWIEQGAIL